ncbi:hypothetical protein IWW36_001362 [Coemansia brasiliensis]|uniref:Uncharacterized protein n=1 Tax=Coemansia brasiliensis TaxID=2650707 RepID=A0A9W8I989_9FUNG|nr:hypothetical protein IWW36_001362 [Coemansia brasiliensis]
MEEYIKNIESQTIPLSVIDTQGSFSNIPFVFMYENKDGSSDFMPSHLLRDSFFRTMGQLPIFAGRIVTRGIGNVSIVVDANNINMPDYKEDSSNVPFSQLKAAGYKWSSWPEGVATAGPMTKADKNGEIKLINVHVIRLLNNSGVMIYLSIPHYVLDGESHMEVMRRWCQVYQLMASDQFSAIDDLPQYTFDRAVLQQNLPDERQPVDEITHKTFTEYSYLSEWFAWISPEWRGYILSKIIEWQHAEAHLFHVSNASFESLRAVLREHVPNIDEISKNEILLSLASKTLAQSQMASEGRSPGASTAKNSTLPVAVIFEVRKYLQLMRQEYIGNVLIPKISLQSLEDLEMPTNAESLSRIMSTFKDTIHSLSAPQIGSHIEMVNLRPSCFTRPITKFSRSKTAMSFVYDIMPDMYKADFGNGRPEWVSPIQPFRANAVLLLTSHDPTDGVDVFMTAYPRVMKEILKNEFWTNFAKIIY